MIRLSRCLRRIGLWIVLVMCSRIALAGFDRSLSIPVYVDKERPVQRVLIYKHHSLLTGNEALIITDPSEIQELLSLLSGNETMLHTCGYHWVFRFQHRLLSASTHAHNQECEKYRRHNRKIHRLFNSYFSRINEDPSHFLYDIHIDARYEPEVVASHLMHDDVYVFCLNPESRWPYLRLRSTTRMKIKKDGDFTNIRERLEIRRMLVKTKIQEAGLELKKKYSVQKIEGPTYMEGPDELEQVVFEFIVYFDPGQQLEGLDHLLDGVKIVERNTPLEYIIQLASPVKLNTEEMTQLQKEYDFIRAIEPFNLE